MMHESRKKLGLVAKLVRNFLSKSGYPAPVEPDEDSVRFKGIPASFSEPDAEEKPFVLGTLPSDIRDFVKPSDKGLLVH